MFSCSYTLQHFNVTTNQAVSTLIHHLDIRTVCHMHQAAYRPFLYSESTVVHTWWPHSDHCRTSKWSSCQLLRGWK